MFCPKCGTQNKDDAAFCGGCGAPLGKAAPASSPAAAAVAKKPGSGKGKLIAAIVAVVALIAIIIGVVVSCSSGGKELLPGTYKYGKTEYSYTSYLSMDIAEGNKVTFTSGRISPRSGTSEESISGIYEFTSSVDGSNVYTVKDLKLPNGQNATTDDLYDAFGGYSDSDYSDVTITMILPAGYENGDIEGRCGFVRSDKAPDGRTGAVGSVMVINSDGTGVYHPIYAEGDPVDLLTDTSLTADNAATEDGEWTFGITKNAPGRYTLVNEYDSSYDITIPVK